MAQYKYLISYTHNNGNANDSGQGATVVTLAAPITTEKQLRDIERQLYKENPYYGKRTVLAFHQLEG